jgi:hypothetical protein
MDGTDGPASKADGSYFASLDATDAADALIPSQSERIYRHDGQLTVTKPVAAAFGEAKKAQPFQDAVGELNH